MEPVIEQLPDGRVLRFPPGTPPEVVARTRERVLAESSEPAVATPPAEAATSPARGGGESAGRLSDAYLARMLRGTLVNRVDPAAEMLVRGFNAIGLAPDSEVRRVQEINAERRRLHEESRQRVGDTGIDGAGVLGTMVSDVVTLPGAMRVVGAGNLIRPQSLLDIAKAGAVAGGITGVVSPTEKSESMSGGRLALEKAKQAGLGAGFGLVAAPLASVGIDKAAQFGRHITAGVAQGARNLFAPSRDVEAVASPRELEMFLASQSANAGIAWERVPETIRESLREATRRAVSSTGTLPREAVRNRLIAEAERLPPLTVGQATRDPMQFSREMNSPEETLRNFLGSQRNTATTRLAETGQRLGGTEHSPYSIGQLITQTVQREAEARRKAVDALYTAARDDASGYHKITNTPEFVKAALAKLKVEQTFDNLPPQFQRQLLELEEQGGRLSIRDAVQLRQNLNSFYDVTKGKPEGVAIGAVKSELDKLLENAQFSFSKDAPEAVKKFMAASAERRKLGKWMDSSAALKLLSETSPDVAAERVFERFVMQGSVDDFGGLWKTLPPEVRLDVKRRFVDTVAGMGLNNFGTQATNAGAAIRFLRQYPKEKLSLMFPEHELKSLRNTLEYIRLTQEAPPGNFVNRSNSLVDLKDFLSQTSNIPLVGPGISRPLRALQEQVAASEAMNSGALVAPKPPAETPAIVRALAQRTPKVVAPQLPEVSRIGTMLGEQEEQ